MDIIDSRVRKCEDVSTVIDKKMRTRTIRFEKFIVPLTENNPFEAGNLLKYCVNPILKSRQTRSVLGLRNL